MVATSTTTDRRTVIGAFDDTTHAEGALNALRDAGFRPEQVSVVARDRDETNRLVEETGMGGEGTAAGAVTGGVLGGLAGFLVGISALVIPGIGPIVGTGILVSTLAGAGIGAAAGGLIGALTEQGVPEEEARGYEEHVRGGRLLLTVHADDDAQAATAHRILDSGRGADVRAYGTGAAQEPMSRIGRTETTAREDIVVTDTAASPLESRPVGRMTPTTGTADITTGELRDENEGATRTSRLS